MFHGSQSFHAVPVHLPDVRSTYLGGGRPTPFQGNPFGRPLCPRMDVVIVVDAPQLVNTAERAVKVGDAAFGFLV